MMEKQFHLEVAERHMEMTKILLNDSDGPIDEPCLLM